MSALKVDLFGKLRISCDGICLDCLEAAKAQELLCYMLIYRAWPHPREKLAGLLWGDYPTVQSKKYLRQVLWQLQTCLEKNAEITNGPLILLDAEWIQINPDAELWLDVELFEQAYLRVQGVAGRGLDEAEACSLKETVELYRGDLLDGWYQDWCLFERQRFEHMYLTMLGKLMGYCEANGDYEAGVEYGMRVLRYDHAHERTHRSLMRLQYRSGDRVAAIRQYERCVAALRDELDVAPSRQTEALRQQILDDALTLPLSDRGLATQQAAADETLGQLKQIAHLLGDLQRQVFRNINAVEQSLRSEQ
jgi:DNA-binding SARP family transcriptional activator